MSNDTKVLGNLNRAAAGAALNNGGWKKRPIETLTCPSGQEVQIRRPGPEFMLRAGKVARTFSQVLTRDLDNEKDGLSLISDMTDDEQAAVLDFARELVCAMVVNPPLTLKPKTPDELTPDDIADDMWFLLTYAMTGFFNLPVPVGDNQEVQVSDLKSFRSDDSVSRDSADGTDVRTDTE
jgi:hypothetical protein